MWYLVNKKILAKGFRGVTIFPFIIMKDKSLMDNEIFINHEKIHYKQQMEMLVIPFYIWYGIEYLIRLIQYKDTFEAYKNISFEREAYSNQSNFNYLKKRKVYSFLKHL